MQIAIVHNGAVTAVGDYRSLFPQTSFSTAGPSASFLAENSCKPVTFWLPHDRDVQKLVPAEPYLLEDTVYTVRVEALTADDLAQRKAAKAADIRAQRDALLKDSDWTQLADYSKANQGAWKQYRQQLRDVPQQAGFPDSIVWPTAPGAA